MSRIEQLEADVGDADALQRLAEGFRSQVEKKFIPLAGIDVDGPHLPQVCRVSGDHADGVPGEPALPHLGQQLSGGEVVGEMDRAIGISRVAGGHAPIIEQMHIAFPRERWPAA